MFDGSTFHRIDYFIGDPKNGVVTEPYRDRLLGLVFIEAGGSQCCIDHRGVISVSNMGHPRPRYESCCEDSVLV